MAWHLYAVPALGTGAKDDVLRPKYIDAMGVESAGIIYGRQPAYLVAADVSDAQDVFIAAQPDAQKVPDALDANPTAAGVTRAQSVLEAMLVPAGWMTTALTWRVITRTVAGLFLFLQRYITIRGSAARLMDGTTVTLETRFNQLPVAVRQALQDTAADLGYDTLSLTATSTLRQILKAMADQWSATPIRLGGVTL